MLKPTLGSSIKEEKQDINAIHKIRRSLSTQDSCCLLLVIKSAKKLWCKKLIAVFSSQPCEQIACFQFLSSSSLQYTGVKCSRLQNRANEKLPSCCTQSLLKSYYSHLPLCKYVYLFQTKNIT